MPQNKIPNLRTERLLLRSLEESDLEDIKNNICEKVIKYLPLIPWPYELSDAKNYIKYVKAKEKSGEEFTWGLCLDKHLIGTITLSFEESNRARISFLLNKNHFRKGIMYESVLKILHYGFYEKKLNKIYTGAIDENIASLNLLKKCGFSIDGKNRKHILNGDKYVDEVILSLLRKEYQK